MGTQTSILFTEIAGSPGSLDQGRGALRDQGGQAEPRTLLLHSPMMLCWLRYLWTSNPGGCWGCWNNGYAGKGAGSNFAGTTQASGTRARLHHQLHERVDPDFRLQLPSGGGWNVACATARPA